MRSIYLVRHGQTDWNAIGKAQGHSDIPLNELGQRQAHKLVEAIPASESLQIWSSDLTRCIQTAQPIADRDALFVKPMKELRERTFGEWEGEDYGELKRRMGGDSISERYRFRPPGGESMADVWERITPVVNNALNVTGDLMIVTHGGTNAILLSQFLSGKLETAACFRFGNCSVTELQLDATGAYRLDRFACEHHLRSLTHSIEAFGVVG